MLKAESMVKGTRAGLRNRDDENRSSRKSSDTMEGMSNGSTRTVSSSGSKPSAKVASGQTRSSPLNTRKSERLEKRTPPTTPVPRKSERLVKHSTPSPLGRSDRGKHPCSSSTSGSDHSGKSFSSVDAKKKKEKKEKSMKQITMESGDVVSSEKYDKGSSSLKRKRMDARSYKSLFKAQKRRYSISDSGNKLERQDTLPRVDNIESRRGGFKLVEDEDRGHKCDHAVIEHGAELLGGASEAAPPVSVSGFQDIDANIQGNDVEAKCLSSSREHDLSENPPDHLDVVDEDISKTSHTITATLDEATRRLEDYSSAEILKIPESVASTNMPRSTGSDTFSDSTDHNGNSKSMSSTRNRQSNVAEMEFGKYVMESSCLQSTNLEKHDIPGSCVICYKKRRLTYDSPEEELCCCTAINKDNGDAELAVNSESIQRYDRVTGFDETLYSVQTDYDGTVCVKCKQPQPRELLHCNGKGCKRCFHLSCLDPILNDAPPGIWHCSYCTKKKMEFGIYTVTKGVGSIWDAREVVVTDSKGTRGQKQYLVKYQGLAHVYNHWVTESELLLESPSLVTNYNENNQRIVWNLEWTVPSRLLRKRPLISLEPEDKCSRMGTEGTSDCRYEWLVKWRGLDYVHCTWEMENASFLQSTPSQRLIKEYGIRYERSKRVVDKSPKGSSVKLQKLLAGGSTLSDGYYFPNLHKLRELWYRNQNAVVFDEQERFANVIFFILSMSNDHQPFLITSTSESLSQWEAEFMRLAPSVDVVVYRGNINTRRSIRALEFHEEDKDGVMLQVLLSPIDVVLEDIHFLKWLKWKVIVVDECQTASPYLKKMKLLDTDMRLLLFSGPMKDTAAEYLGLLSLLGSPDDLYKAGGSKFDTIDDLVKVKEIFSRFTAYSRFVEYLVPVEISNLQLEQYCATLHTNAIALRSNSYTDQVGAFKEILVTLRKCCDHPYIVDTSLQPSIIAGLTPDQALEVETKASGKLQLLYEILSKIREQRLKALVLFQSIVGSGGIAIGDILDDFVRGKFGQNSYERIDACLNPAKKQAALNRFNEIGGEQFVFLLENRACQPSIKLSVDTVVIFDSELNPANDIKALQRLAIHSQSESINVFRLYSSCTIEERVLILGKQNHNVENNLQRIKYISSLLMWGASCLFGRLDKYHAGDSSNSAEDISSGQKLLHDVILDLSAVMSGCFKKNDKREPIISEVSRSGGTYNINFPLLGEKKVQLTDVEEPHTFWKRLLEGKNPRWKYAFKPTPRSRKRVQYAEGSSSRSEMENDDSGKKRKKVAFSAASMQLEQEESQDAGFNREASTVAAGYQSQSLPASVALQSNKLNAKNAASSFSPRKSYSNRSGMAHFQMKSPENLHAFVKAEIRKLCEILNLSKEVQQLIDRFLEYVMENHQVNKEPVSILEAFQMSVCWTAASILKQKIDKKDSLELARRVLNFKCTEEEAILIYEKLRLLKRTFLQLPATISGLMLENSKSALADISSRSAEKAGEPPSKSFNLQNVKAEFEERSSNQELPQEPNDKLTGKKLRKIIKKTQKNCDKRMSKLHLKHENEIQEFQKMWAEKKEKLDAEHRKEVIFVRAIHGNSTAGIDKLKKSDAEFAKKIAEHEHLKEVQFKELEAKHTAATEEERKKISNWLAEAKSSSNQSRVDNEVHIHVSDTENEIGFLKVSPAVTGKGTETDVLPSGLDIEERNLDRIDPAAEASDAIPPNPGLDVEAVDHSIPTETGTGKGTAVTGKGTEIDVLPSELDIAEQDLIRIDPAAEATEAIPPNPRVALAVEAVEHSIPFETLPILLNSNFERESEAAEVEASFIPRVEQCKEASQSSQGIASSEEHVTDEVPSTGQNTEMPVSGPGYTDCETGHANGGGTRTAVDTSISKLQILNETLSTNQSNEVAARVPDNTGSEMGHDHAEETSTPFVSSSGSDGGDIVINRGSSPEGLTSLQLPSAALTDSLQPIVEREFMDKQDEDTPGYVTTVGITSAASDAGTSSQTNCEEVPENGEQLEPASEEIAPGCSHSPAAQAVDQGQPERINCLQNSVASLQLLEESVEVSHPAVPQDAENTVLNPPSELLSSAQCHSHPDLLMANRSDHEPNSEQPAHSQSMEVQVNQNAAELRNLAVPQSWWPNLAVPEASHLQLYGTHRAASWNTLVPSQPEPLQNELERIGKEIERATKLHLSTKSQLESDREKEILEMAAQIRNKYNAKLKDAETAFVLKKTELESNQKKVHMNRILAEAFRSKCLVPKPSGVSGIQQVSPSSYVQHLQHQLSLRSSVTHSPVNNHCPVNSFVQPSRRSAGNVSASTARPPLINSITPSIVNARACGDVRAPAPHLQPFRPAASSANMSSLPSNPNQQGLVTSHLLPPISSQQELLISSTFLQPSPPSPATRPPVKINQSGSGNQLSESNGVVQSGPQNASLSALELLRNVQNQPSGRTPNTLPCPPCSGSNTGVVDPAPDVVCLSDDE